MVRTIGVWIAAWNCSCTTRSSSAKLSWVLYLPSRARRRILAAMLTAGTPSSLTHGRVLIWCARRRKAMPPLTADHQCCDFEIQTVHEGHLLGSVPSGGRLMHSRTLRQTKQAMVQSSVCRHECDDGILAPAG